MSPMIHVARDGAPIGQFRRDLIADLLRNQTLRATDLYYDDIRREWLPIGELKSPQKFTSASDAGGEEAGEEGPPPEESAEISEASESESGGSRRRRRRRRGEDSGPRKPRKRHPAEAALPGWIAALIAIGVAAGLWAWATSLRDELETSLRKVKELEGSVASLQRQNSILLEMAPPGVIRGVLTTEPFPGRLAVLSGISVGVYRLDDVRSAIFRVANLPLPVTEQEFASMVSLVQSSLPPPIAMSLSDSSGRFEIPLPEPGNYALVATGLKQAGGSVDRLFWALEVAAGDSPTPVVSLNEANASSLREPKFRIVPARR